MKVVNFFSPESLEIATDGSCDCCEFYKVNIGDFFFDIPDGPPERFIKTSRNYAVNLDAGYLAEIASKRMVYYWGRSSEEPTKRKFEAEVEP